MTRLLAAACALALLAAAPAAAKPRYRVTVTRDGAGIPHIRAANFASLGFGEGYAYAQDNLCTLADDIVTVRAQRSRYFGPDALSIGYANGAADPNLKSDFFWQRIRDAKVIDKLLAGERPPAEVVDLYRGYAAGYNAYLRSGKLRDPRCKGKPWVRPITVQDLYLRGLQTSEFGSSARFISGIVDAQPPAAGARAARTRAHVDLAGLRRTLGEVPDPSMGSNGIGLGKLGTKGKDGMVLANPHFPWRGTERFWLMQLTVPGKYDVFGGTLSGFPLVGIGFNRHLAWTHTVSTARRFVIYQLQLDPNDPTSYMVDGKPVKMTTQTVRVGTQQHTFYLTRYGPVVTIPQAGYAWSKDTAYALTDVEENLRGARQYLDIGRASSVRALLKAEQRDAGIPSFNTVAADDRGEALYADQSVVPDVSKAKIGACTPSGLPQLVFASARLITLDGSRGACALGHDPSAPVAGILGAKSMPHLFRNDYVENSNDSYWLANPAHPLTGFSPIIGLEGTQQGLRTRLGNAMIKPLLGKFTIPVLQQMWENDRSLGAELLARPLAAACRANPQVAEPDGSTVDVSQACDVLDRYGDTGNLNDAGGWLFSEWYRRAPANGLKTSEFDPARPLDTPTSLNTDDPAVLQALGAAVADLRARGIPLDATYGQVQHATRGSQKIPIHGCNTGCFQNISAGFGGGDPTQQTPDYGEVYTGSSMVLTTELTSKGPRSQGILTYSQASDPTSPWYANMTKLFSQKRWVKMRFTAAELRADPKARTVVLSQG